MVLFVNACVRAESRTYRLAQHLLKKLGEYEEVQLTELDLKPLDEATLNRRYELIDRGDFSDPMFDLAKQFARADQIVIAAPYWDLSFPAILKTYIENIFMIGLVSEYDGNGVPHGLCRASDLYYVTTAGGPFDASFGYRYIEMLVKQCFGVRETHLIKAELLDVDGADVEAILAKTMDEIELM